MITGRIQPWKPNIKSGQSIMNTFWHANTKTDIRQYNEMLSWGGVDLVSVTQMTRVCTFLFSELPVITVLQAPLVQRTTNFAKHPVSLPSFISYCFFSPAYIVKLLRDVSKDSVYVQFKWFNDRHTVINCIWPHITYTLATFSLMVVLLGLQLELQFMAPRLRRHLWGTPLNQEGQRSKGHHCLSDAHSDCWHQW